MLRNYAHTWTRGAGGPSASAPFRQFLFSEVVPRKAQLEASDLWSVFLNVFYSGNKLRACNLVLFMKSIL